MKKLLIVILMLMPVYCFAEIIPIEKPKELTKGQQRRAIDLLNQIYKNVTDSNFILHNPHIPEKYVYAAFFVQAKLMTGQKEPVELLIFQKDGGCFGCHEAGIATLGSDGSIIDRIDVVNYSGRINVSLIKYNNEGDALILTEQGTTHAGGTDAGCQIYKINKDKKFISVYSKSLILNERYGWDVSIGVTLTAVNKDGFQNILVKEHLKTIKRAIYDEPQKENSFKFELPSIFKKKKNRPDPPRKPADIDKTVTINTKELEKRDD